MRWLPVLLLLLAGCVESRTQSELQQAEAQLTTKVQQAALDEARLRVEKARLEALKKAQDVCVCASNNAPAPLHDAPTWRAKNPVNPCRCN